MEAIIINCDEDSDSSIEEVVVPPKTPPPVINIDVEDELVLNITQQVQVNVIKHTVQCDPSPLIPTTSNISPCHWTKDMMKFYNESWGDEASFSVKTIQASMDRNPAKWVMGRKDLTPMRTRKLLRVRCCNCQQVGHYTNRCPDPVRIPKCYMCGDEGHLESACKTAKCLTCGSKKWSYSSSCKRCEGQQARFCYRCKMRGHDLVDCTDNWRRFHLTTTTDELRVPSATVMKPRHLIWCSNCASEGHHYAECRGLKTTFYTDSNPFMTSYFSSFLVENFNPSREGFIEVKPSQEVKETEEQNEEKRVNTPSYRYFLNTIPDFTGPTHTLTNPDDDKETQWKPPDFIPMSEFPKEGMQDPPKVQEGRDKGGGRSSPSPEVQIFSEPYCDNHLVRNAKRSIEGLIPSQKKKRNMDQSNNEANILLTKKQKKLRRKLLLTQQGVKEKSKFPNPFCNREDFYAKELRRLTDRKTNKMAERKWRRGRSKNKKASNRLGVDFTQDHFP